MKSSIYVVWRYKMWVNQWFPLMFTANIFTLHGDRAEPLIAYCFFLCRSLESFKSVSGKSSLSLHSVFPNGKHNIMILLWMVASVWKMLLILVIIFNFRLQQRSVMDWTLSLLTAFDRGSARSLILCSGSTNVGKKKKNEFADSVVIRRSLCRWVCSCSITQ